MRAPVRNIDGHSCTLADAEAAEGRLEGAARHLPDEDEIVRLDEEIEDVQRQQTVLKLRQQARGNRERTKRDAEVASVGVRSASGVTRPCRTFAPSCVACSGRFLTRPCRCSRRSTNWSSGPSACEKLLRNRGERANNSAAACSSLASRWSPAGKTSAASRDVRHSRVSRSFGPTCA